MARLLLLVLVPIYLLAAAPARAVDGISVPEPSDLALFALGLLGLLIGHRSASWPKKHKKDRNEKR